MRTRRSLTRHPDFMRLWAGQTVSVFGSLTTGVALPFTAIIYLDASPLAVALLTAANVAAGIMFGLVAGVWVDRLRRRPIMIAADVGRAALVGSIPLAAWFGVLRIEQLFVIAFLSGVLTIFFDVAYQSYLPTLVEPDQLLEGNSKLAASASVSEFGAFSAGGWLVQLITGPGAMLVDAVSFVFSAGSLLAIRAREPAPAPAAERTSIVREARDGLRAIAGDAVLRPLAGSFVALSFGFGMTGAVYVLFVTRDLGLSPGVQGMIYGVGGVSSLAGALLAERARQFVGAGRAMMFGLALGGIGMAIMAFAPSITAVVVIILLAQQLISDPGWTIYEINSVSLRQATAAGPLLGRVNAGTRFSGMLATLIGSLVAGITANSIGARPVLVLSSLSMLVGVVWIALSPVRAMRDAPTEITEVDLDTQDATTAVS
jgi:MFS family permease